MASKPRTREEKIEFLKKLARGQAKIEDILPKVNIYFFEKEPGIYSGFLYGYLGYIAEFIPSKKRPDASIIEQIRRECKSKRMVDSAVIFEYHGIMPYEECERLRQFAEKEF